GELVNRTATGESFVVWASINALRDDKGKLIGYMSVETDMTELHNVRKALLSQATTDHLTGLPNRAMYLERLEHHIQLAKRSRQPFAVLFADLDHFKEVNDTQGHDVGDDLLRQIARRLRDALR
ncbi:GGDEF domain-containing protein, partial [Arthrospira platensis SPKY1]|nr:GGDEF domain-containing protein [Arthrospira platensis SPKY1]